MTTSLPDPTITYDFSAYPSERIRSDRPRLLHQCGRSGLNLPGIRDRLVIPQHTLNQPEGSLSLWVMALDHLHTYQQFPQHTLSNERAFNYPLLSDQEAIAEPESCRFTLVFDSYWHPTFLAKFYYGPWPEGPFAKEPKAGVLANHATFAPDEWSHLVLTWDRPKSRYRLYLNGVLIGAEDSTFEGQLLTDDIGEILYAGIPTWCFSQLDFYKLALEAKQVAQLFSVGEEAASPETTAKLRSTHLGLDLPSLSLPEGNDWKETSNLSLTEPEHLSEFFVQGCNSAPRITPEGLEIKTPDLEGWRYFQVAANQGQIRDQRNVYLWHYDWNEGDLHVQFEFKSLRRGGLALLMANCSGMQGEDFLRDYALRTTALMKTVCWEDVRNYHWEFYREMVDTRNDIVSHAMLKNPWFTPVAYQTEARQWELDRWYRFDYVQEGGRIRGAIDGTLVIDTKDQSGTPTGPLLRRGHCALRCMSRTHLLVRNWRIRSRPLYTEA